MSKVKSPDNVKILRYTDEFSLHTMPPLLGDYGITRQWDSRMIIISFNGEGKSKAHSLWRMNAKAFNLMCADEFTYRERLQDVCANT